MFEWLRSLLPQMPHYGYLLVFIVVFLNNLGLPLPGETILLGAGFILGKSAHPLWPPMVAAIVACFLGGIVAFWVGRRLGHSGLEEKMPWLHLTPERLAWPERFFKRYGSKTVFFARFMPLFPPVGANLLAGLSDMRWGIFLLFNLTGSVVYAVMYILIGYFFGKKWKLLEAWLGTNLLYVIVAGVAVLALVLFFRHFLFRLSGVGAQRTGG